MEDPHAADDELFERCTGDPTARMPGLKKIYRRGFEAEVPSPSDSSRKGKVRGEVEVEEPSETQNPRRRVEAGEEIAEIVESGSVEPGERDGANGVGSPWSDHALHKTPIEGVVARTGTPPLHARVDAYRFDNIPEGHEDNPWA